MYLQLLYYILIFKNVQFTVITYNILLIDFIMFLSVLNIDY